MNARIITLMAAAAIAVAPLGASALGTNEKGCLVGGAAGGVIGHTVKGNDTLLGAAIGCGAGVLINKQRVKKEDEKARHSEAENRRQARRDRELAQARERERERIAESR
ncbi:MAG TPA: glycine zipper 2TM domain-containing protein [Usitatibacter sp.]|jgi:outer membrane lipoprotein SlyB|nr:glycine zipper 2TM domain-containing protein [Usitatibacter sp.]